MKTRYAVQLTDPTLLVQPYLPWIKHVDSLEDGLPFVEEIRTKNIGKEYYIQLVISQRER
ncbi:MAG: hypothetical protein V3U54_13275 [Thermodesulfobacteriota bacterium]